MRVQGLKARAGRGQGCDELARGQLGAIIVVRVHRRAPGKRHQQSYQQ
jgi:hypothetical protein